MNNNEIIIVVIMINRHKYKNSKPISSCHDSHDSSSTHFTTTFSSFIIVLSCSVVTIIGQNIAIFRRPRGSCARRDCRLVLRTQRRIYRNEASIGRAIHSPRDIFSTSKRCCDCYRTTSWLSFSVWNVHARRSFLSLAPSFFFSFLFLDFLYASYYQRGGIFCSWHLYGNQYQSNRIDTLKLDFFLWKRTIVIDLFLWYFNRG